MTPSPPSPSGNLLLCCFNFSSLYSALAALFCNSSLSSVNFCLNNRRVSRGGGGSRGPRPPPMKLKSQKKRQILSYYTYILLLFQSETSFSELGPPTEKLNSQKKAFQIFDPPPPLRIPGHATEQFSIFCFADHNFGR